MATNIEHNKIREQSTEGLNREKEKIHRKEIRKLLDRALQETLSNLGFHKIKSSTWGRKVGNAWEIVYLQRSQFSHRYYIEAGVCEEKDRFLYTQKQKKG